MSVVERTMESMNTNTAPPFCSIVPPQILHRLARSSDERVAAAAQRTLAVRSRIVGKREVRARNPRRGGPTAGGLVPPSLQERTRRPTAALEPDQGASATGAAAPKRSVYDAQGKTQLPGVIARCEGDPAAADESVNEAYNGLGATWSLLHEAYGRDSLDGQGLPLIATVHYDKHFDNAYWDGEQMVFGDGDGIYFSSFTDSVDVIGHELAHGLTQYTAGLVYVGQSGALNESISDVIGSMVKQRELKHTAAQADWLIGEGLFTAKVQGVALRSMKAPGTAYDDPHLGKDPQPATMDDYQKLPHDDSGDNGGVHINSGIPNHAFYLAAIAIGGHSWESVGPVWYDTITAGRLPKDADFATFAAATLRAAGGRYGVKSAQQQAIEDAWRTVKVL